MKSYLQWTVAIAATIQSCVAQTYTDCNPMKKTCPADTGLNQYTLESDFTDSAAFDWWNTTSGTVETTDLGAAFTISSKGDAPTIESNFYIFFGYVEIKMRAANGTGIISTSVLESDDLDEIDWEQISTYDTEIQTNYFGKGNTTSYDRGTTVTVTTPEETFHTYGVSWTSDKTEWYVDGTLVRTLNYADALSGENYPQTPMRIKIGIWAGGDSDNSAGTIEWAGGETDYSDGPFTMYVESVKVVNYTPAKEYTYTDKTGSWDSIKASNATAAGSNLVSGSSSSAVAGSSSSSAVVAASSSASVVRTSSASAASVVVTATGSSAVVAPSGYCKIVIAVTAAVAVASGFVVGW